MGMATKQQLWIPYTNALVDLVLSFPVRYIYNRGIINHLYFTRERLESLTKYSSNGVSFVNEVSLSGNIQEAATVMLGTQTEVTNEIFIPDYRNLDSLAKASKSCSNRFFISLLFTFLTTPNCVAEPWSMRYWKHQAISRENIVKACYKKLGKQVLKER
jgi:hypothetical protein